MTRTISGVDHRLVLGCYVDDLFTLYSHEGDGSLYDQFVSAFTKRSNVENKGPVSDLLNVDIATHADCVELKQEKYIAHLVSKTCPTECRSPSTKRERPLPRHCPS
eukprot:633374-Pleurochrysis_carterae.AAC.1